MSIQTQIDRLKGNISASYSAVQEMGGTVPENANSDNLPGAIRTIQGGSLPDDMYEIVLTADPFENGVVSGGGVAQNGMLITVSAKKKSSYVFSNWKENGASVFNGTDYTFLVERNRNLSAVFVKSTTLGPWVASSLPSSEGWYSVTYGNGRFVAVASSNGKAAYSDDGITWTASTLPSSEIWVSVTYGNGRFIAVTNRNRKAAYSDDGITWVASSLPSSENWNFVTYGNGRFVAVASSNGKAAYSDDGITWVASSLPSSENWRSVAYGDGKFVAVASGRNHAAYSDDGVTWTASTFPSQAYWYSVVYGNGRFAAIALQSNKASWCEFILPKASLSNISAMGTADISQALNQSDANTIDSVAVSIASSGKSELAAVKSVEQ